MKHQTIEVAREVEAQGTGPPRFELSGVFDDGVVAGLTVRGVDMGLAGRESAGRVIEQWMQLSGISKGIDGVVVSRQIHGAAVLLHRGPLRGLVVLDGYDGHVTRVPGLMLAVTVADCVPVYLSVPGRAVALLHAGWRGVAAGGLESIVARLTAASEVGPEQVRLHLGVAICGECYEVGPDVVEALRAPEGRTVDLRATLAARARALGITKVTTSPWCSRHDPIFHSYRRDGERAGRMVAYVVRSSLASSPTPR